MDEVKLNNEEIQKEISLLKENISKLKFIQSQYEKDVKSLEKLFNFKLKLEKIISSKEYKNNLVEVTIRFHNKSEISIFLNGEFFANYSVDDNFSKFSLDFQEISLQSFLSSIDKILKEYKLPNFESENKLISIESNGNNY